MKPTIALLAAIGGTLIAAAPASAADKYITASEVAAAPGGYFIDIGEGDKAEIQRIRAPRGKIGECKVHLPSVQKLAAQARDKNRIGIPVGIQLQYHDATYDPHSAILPGSCQGAGTGCTIFVFIPS